MSKLLKIIIGGALVFTPGCMAIFPDYEGGPILITPEKGETNPGLYSPISTNINLEHKMDKITDSGSRHYSTD